MEFLTIFIVAVVLGIINFEIRIRIEKWLERKMDFLMWAAFTGVILAIEIQLLNYWGILK